VVILALSPDQQTKIQDFCFNEPKTVNQILSYLKLSGTKALMSLYNYFKTQKAKLLFFIENKGGFLWVRTNPLNFFKPLTRLDNIDKQNTEKTKNPNRNSLKDKNDNSKTYKPLTGLVRAGPERVAAALIMNRIHNFGYYNKEEKEFKYTTEAKKEIDQHFKDYCNRVRFEKIILSRAPDGNPIFSQDLIINYKTRFTSQQRQQENIEGFRAVYQAASKRFMKGVFLTLTAQPRAQETLWEANRRMLVAWGKMQRFLKRALPERACWIKVAEFQENGRLHFHIIIFGVNWIATKKLLQYTWCKYGGGPIMDIHTIKQEPLRGWVWARSCPLESAGKEPGDLLASYLEKSMSMSHGSLYWVTGVRNWTASKNLQERVRPKETISKSQEKPVKPSGKKYFLKGVLSTITGFRMSHRKDSMSLYGDDRDLQKKETSGKSSQKTKTQPKQSLTFCKATDLYLKSIHGGN
jgi:hypothetical protein